ncbi:hypothetical protein AWC38_SpisGene17668 [Stylophora pistillata]|uniref:Uncharacterized protein n=1 Tax=Stylophora pistillata TaxID=50429 RepID=A0A2B4RLE3_STYPI|nr:hypothetical protein AWC38_SpisGene17668 [Stylophora pistillata]
MAATGGIEADIQVIDQNPESSQGKSMNSEKDNTAEVISKAIQSQLAAMLPTMIHETLAKKNLEGTASSSQTLNISSISLPRLAAGSTQGSNDSVAVRLAAGSTQGLNDGQVEISDPPSKKTEVSEANEDVSEDLTHPAGRWEASEELSSFLDVMFAGKPLSVYDRKQITKDFPLPNVESVFTPVLDDYLSSFVTGAKGVDKEAKKFQDQFLDIVGSALTLLGSVNAQYKVHRRKQVLEKLNPQMSSLASEPFPEAGKNLFGPYFEEKQEPESDDSDDSNDESKDQSEHEKIVEHTNHEEPEEMRLKRLKNHRINTRIHQRRKTNLKNKKKNLKNSTKMTSKMSLTSH